jgi:N6-adenosine-specific RNA methylase IME4
MDILGQFGVIMADPPCDIHMELPYGTMADDEMRTLNVPTLQTDGLIFFGSLVVPWSLGVNGKFSVLKP